MVRVKAESFFACMWSSAGPETCRVSLAVQL